MCYRLPWGANQVSWKSIYAKTRHIWLHCDFGLHLVVRLFSRLQFADTEQQNSKGRASLWQKTRRLRGCYPLEGCSESIQYLTPSFGSSINSISGIASGLRLQILR